MAKAAAAKAQLLRLQPGLTIARLLMLRLSGTPASRQEFDEHIIGGLRKAGLPEQ